MLETTKPNKFKNLIPLILLVLMLFASQNWWRLQLLIDPLPAESITEQDVVLYSTVWCPYCKKARSFLQHANIPFTEYDIEKSAYAYQQYQRLSGRGVPVIRIGNRTVQGYNTAAMREAINELNASKIFDQ
jgi:glutaredoxin